MNKKYFLRGFGVGVLVTSLVFGGYSMIKSNSTRVSPTNEPGKGAVVSESPLSAETEEPADQTATKAPETASPSPAPQASQTPAATQAAAATRNPVTTDQPSQAQNPSGTKTPSDTQAGGQSSPAPQQSDVQANAGAVSNTQESSSVAVEIPRGADSYTTASKLKDAGLIEDVREFDNYLEERGYANRLNPGTYSIEKGSTYEQIARKIAEQAK